MVKRVSALIIGLSIACASVQADEFKDTVKLGYGAVSFHANSGDLTGPPGTTPPGVQVDLDNTNMYTLSYERRLSNHWSVMLQAGVPPTIHIKGAGNGASLGEVAKTKAWFPSLLLNYKFTDFHGFSPYAGVGVSYFNFTDKSVSAAYTSAFQGSRSSMDIKNFWGPVARLGVEYQIDDRMVLDLAYLRFWMDTTTTISTVTPGFGTIDRKIDINGNSDVIALAFGYRF
ncbi:ompW family protein [Pseudomonas fluorescens]|uniref:OmpW family protein n=1 Tax=Pseudomonas fluorescens TaxID=294 RepID=A0A0P8ZWA0_PSEFL|nr:OmpW family outer membrane protein [Pseudomonas fluorescens]KPU61870.1 ompW family protein [Pseudomonas fluorescens]